MKLLAVFFTFMSTAISAQQKPAEGGNIYDKISSQLCNCFVTSSISDSVKRKDHCYQLVLNNNYEELKKYGVDTLADKNFKRYYDLYLKRYSDKKETDHPGIKNNAAHDDGFIGSLIDQKKLSTGEYEITLRATESNTIKKFTSSKPIDQNELKR